MRRAPSGGLLRSGNPGNKGGRPRKALRATGVKVFEKVINELDKNRLKNPKTVPHKELLEIGRFAGDYCVGKKVEVDYIDRGRIEELVDFVAGFVPEDRIEEFFQGLAVLQRSWEGVTLEDEGPLLGEEPSESETR